VQVPEEYWAQEMHIPASVDHIRADRRPHFQTETAPILNASPSLLFTNCIHFITTSGKVRN
jgi:hypothetical protein